MRIRTATIMILLALIGLPFGSNGSNGSGATGLATTDGRVVDSSTLTGKVMCGYQGWFNTEGDGSGRGWVHWGRNGKFEPGTATVDLWPDMSELDPDEKYPTGFHYPDGRVAEVFSSYNHQTVTRHLRWMQEYGIDGVFLQRFATGIGKSEVMRHYTAVLSHIRDGAWQYGRVYGLMYDLSGVCNGQIDRVIEDWKYLIAATHLTEDPQYIRHHGKPVVALWGLGFSGSRDALIEDGMRLVKFLKEDHTYGGNTVMLGVPKNWRTLDNPAVPGDKLKQLILLADIVSPWTVGAYRSPAEVVQNAVNNLRPDMAWCGEHGKDYMPVVYPGFSWHNLHQGPINEIPRLGGRFLWAQYVEARKAGATMVYQAMFDEMDEGTAVFKCTNDPPRGEGKSAFLTYEGLPTDFYLKLVGRATRMIRREVDLSNEMGIEAAIKQ